MTAGRVAAVSFALLLAGALAALALAQHVRSQLVVDEVELSNRFDPAAGERAAVRFRLTEDEERGTVEVVDSGGRAVDTLAASEPLGDYEIHRFRWSGHGVPSGTYRVRLRLDSLGREILLGERIELRRHDG